MSGNSHNSEHNLMTNRGGVAGDAAGEIIANSDGGDHECTCGGHDVPDDAVMTRDEFERQKALAGEAVQNGNLDALTYLNPHIEEAVRSALDEVPEANAADIDGGNPGVYSDNSGGVVPVAGVYNDEEEELDDGDDEDEDDEDPNTVNYAAATGAVANAATSDVDGLDIPVGGSYLDRDDEPETNRDGDGDGADTDDGVGAHIPVGGVYRHMEGD